MPQHPSRPLRHRSAGLRDRFCRAAGIGQAERRWAGGTRDAVRREASYGLQDSYCPVYCGGRAARSGAGATMLVTRLSGRPDQEADLDAVAALEAATFSNPWTREMLQRELAPPTAARVYVLHLPSCGLAAFCSCWVIADELHVNTIAVRADHRREGLGRALMEHVLADAAAAGAVRATLEVRRSNVAAQHLYASLGFATMGVRRQYYTNPAEDALILWRGPAGPSGAPGTHS